MSGTKEETKVLSQDIEFIDVHNVKICTVKEEPYLNEDGQRDGSGCVKRVIDETKPIKAIREAQKYNETTLKDIDNELRKFKEYQEPPKKSVALAKRLRQDEELAEYKETGNPACLSPDTKERLALEDELRAYQRDLKRHEYFNNFYRHRKRAIQSMHLCHTILTQRQELFPDSSIEPIDTLVPPPLDSEPDLDAPIEASAVDDGLFVMPGAEVPAVEPAPAEEISVEPAPAEEVAEEPAVEEPAVLDESAVDETKLG